MTLRFIRSATLLALAMVLAGCQHQPARSASHAKSKQASHSSKPVHLHGAMTHNAKGKKPKHPTAQASQDTTPVWAGELD